MESSDMIELNVLNRSPLDAEEATSVAENGKDQRSEGDETIEWKPSRFNARAKDDDGELIIWNSRTGNISVFEPEKAHIIERALSQQGFSSRREGVVKYLHERGYILRADADESRAVNYEIQQQQHRSDILHLILLASEDCDFRCVYCYEDFDKGTMLPQVRDGIKNLLERKAPTLSSLSISWFGGEPLYGFEAIEDIAPFASELADEYNIQYMSNMTTNGYQLKPAVAEKLFSWGCRKFQITLDGTPEDHNEKRVARDGSKTFEKIYGNLQKLQSTSHDFTITIRSNFDQDNHPNFEPYFERLKDDFAGDDRFELRFHAVGKWGGPNDADLNTCGFDEKQQVKEKLRRLARERGLKVEGGLDFKGGLGEKVCYAGRPYSFVVGAFGQLMKCTVALDKSDHNIVGHVTPEGRLKVDSEKMALWTSGEYHRDSECEKCQVMPMCQGLNCPLVRIESDGKDKQCASVRWNLKDRIKDAKKGKIQSAREIRVSPD